MKIVPTDATKSTNCSYVRPTTPRTMRAASEIGLIWIHLRLLPPPRLFSSLEMPRPVCVSILAPAVRSIVG
jgi:hypothetical protein